MRITFCWKIPSLVLLCTPAQHLFYSFLLGTLCLDTKTSPLWPLRWMYMTQGREACHQEGWRKSWGPQRGLIKVAVFFLCRKLATHGGRNGTHKRLVMSAVPSFFIMESKSSIEASDWHRRVAGCELFQTTALLCVLQNCGLCKWAGWSSCHQARSNAADHCGCLVSSHVCECFWQEVPPPPNLRLPSSVRLHSSLDGALGFLLKAPGETVFPTGSLVLEVWNQKLPLAWGCQTEPATCPTGLLWVFHTGVFWSSPHLHPCYLTPTVPGIYQVPSTVQSASLFRPFTGAYWCQTLH